MSTYLKWILGDDTGISSKAIFAHMMGVSTSPSMSDHPHDPDDFGRCYRLLCRFPEWRRRMPEMSDRSPVWSRLCGAWEELTQLYEQEVGRGSDRRAHLRKSAPRLYDRMKELGA